MLWRYFELSFTEAFVLFICFCITFSALRKEFICKGIDEMTCLEQIMTVQGALIKAGNRGYDETVNFLLALSNIIVNDALSVHVHERACESIERVLMFTRAGWLPAWMQHTFEQNVSNLNTRFYAMALFVCILI